MWSKRAAASVKIFLPRFFAIRRAEFSICALGLSGTRRQAWCPCRRSRSSPPLGLRCVVRDYNPPALGSALALTSVALKFDVVMNNAEQPHVQRAQQAQDEILRAMSPGRRLEVARELYDTAWQIKAAGLRRQHPDWPEEFLLAKLRRVFVTGYAGA
jgi:hypothetical protein